MAFPEDSQYVPVLAGGAPLTDPANDVSPDECDIVGSTQFPAAYYAYDGTNVYFRLRLNSDPQFKTSFRNFSWGVLFDTDNSPSVLEWELAVNGLDNTLELTQTQTVISPAGNPAVTGSTNRRGTVRFSAPIINFGIARSKAAADGSNFGGNGDFFLDFLIPATVLFPILGISTASPLRFLFFSSANNNNYNKDFTSLSDSLTITGGDVRAALSITQTASSSVIQAGQPASVDGVITVVNTGRSTASTIFAVTAFAFDKLAAFQVTRTSAGMTAFTSLNQTLTWNIGNLAAGASATLSYSASGLFNTPGGRVLDTKIATGVDLFTGGKITSAQSTATLNVVSTGGVNGTVLDGASGLPVAGVSVQVLKLPGLSSAGTAGTDAAGIYSIGNLAPGSYRLQFAYPNYSPLSSDTQVAAGAVTTVNVLLQPLPAAVQGAVTDASNGTSIAGAIVNLTNWLGVHVAQAVSNANGAYAITGITPGYYRISLSASGFQLNDQPLTLSPGETRIVNASLQSNPGAVAGTVTSAGGSPIAGAKIEALDNRNNVLSTTVTAADGTYRLDTLPASSNDRLRVSAPNYVTQVIGFRVLPGQTTTVNLSLSPIAGSIGGTISDAENLAPIGGASVRVFNSEGLTLQTGLSNPDGTYLIPSLSPGSYSVVYAAQGYAGKTVGAIVAAGTQANVSLALERLAGAISGSVASVDGQPIPDVVVRVFSNNIIVGRVNTALDGSFTIGNLAPGDYVVSARPDGYGGVTLGASVNPGQTTALNFLLTPNPGSAAGIITDSNGNPLPGAIVSVQYNVDGGPVILTRVIAQSDGRYTVSNLMPGSYILSVSNAGFQNQFTAVLVRSGQTSTADFILPASPGSISGTVRDTAGNAIFGAGIEIRVTNANGITVSSLFTDSSGRFVAGNLKPGIYTVVSGAANYQQGTATCTVFPDASTSVSLVLAPDPGAIQGRVTDAVTGKGLFGAIVNINDQVGFLAGSVLSDDDGFFRIAGFTPGSYTLVATDNNYQSETFGAIVLSNAETPVSFMLKPNPATITGLLQPAAAGSLVQLFNSNNVQIATSATLADGSFTFNNVQEGNYYLTANAAGFTSPIVGANALPGQVTSVTIPLTPSPGSLSGIVTDTGGNPIPAASVKVLNGNESVRGIGQAQADGTYTVGNLPAGTLNVVASAPSYSSAMKGVSVGPGESVTGISFQLTADPGTVSGQITDGVTGLPIPGADVELRQITASGLAVASVSATPFGNYQFNGLRPDTYTVIARASGYASNTAGAFVGRGQSTIASIALIPLFGELNGQISDTAGNPISTDNTEIKLYTKEGSLLETAFANQQGGVRLIELPAGEYIVNVSSPGYVSASVGATIKAGETTAVAVTLTPQTSVVSGFVTNASTGAPISSALINVYDLSSLIIETTYSDEAGAYIINGLPAGAFSLSTVAAGFGSATASVITKAGAAARADFTLTPSPGSIAGFVSDLEDGKALQGAQIRIFSGETGLLIATVVSGTGGEYHYTDLAPGIYTATAGRRGYASAFGGFTITAAAATRFSFALTKLPGSLNGTVTRAVSGSGIDGCRVQLHQFNSFGPVISSQLSDSNGFYDFGDVAPANYIVAAALSGFVSEQTSALVSPGELTSVPFMLQQAPTVIEGTVTDGASGTPVPNAPVTVVDGTGVIGGNGATNPQGQYEVPSTPSGEQTVVVSKPGQQTANAYVLQRPGQQQTVNVVLTGQPQSIRGIVTEQINGSPIPGAIINALDPVSQLVRVTVIADGLGRFVIEGLSPSTSYTLTASSPNYGSQAIQAASEDGTVQVALPAEFGTLQGTIRDSAGLPLRKALAEIITDSGVVIRQTVSNNNGFYAFTNVAAGTANARFSYPGKQTVVLKPLIQNMQTTILNVVLADEEDDDE
ncbi:carboxypeptidase regulatory-like domain-containing protein [Paenibacillus gorillae]|uniref:carboxypeptidase regulatory-like domain-containing protein n=1 Tax=Paenibacillus gorillae TaxID=1243662 RepID=UPI0004B6BD6E|nr:carboxypeptidase regulatory-like domain-containing protein [Paenibacillus gorillae]